MTTYVLTLAKTFHASHPQAGQPTYFKESFIAGLKIHTIRANFGLWRSRFMKIYAGEAELSVRQWTGRPYCSKMEEIARLSRVDGIGIQRLTFPLADLNFAEIDYTIMQGASVNPNREIDLLARNDGLDYSLWADWFRTYDLTQPFALIHFTPFRY